MKKDTICISKDEYLELYELKRKVFSESREIKILTKPFATMIFHPTNEDVERIKLYIDELNDEITKLRLKLEKP